MNDIRTKIPNTLALLIKDFKTRYIDNIVTERCDENDVSVVNIYKSETPAFIFNLSKFLSDTANYTPSANVSTFSSTLVVKYFKDTDKLQVWENFRDIRHSGKNGKPKYHYYKLKTLIFTLNKNGCYTKINSQIVKLGINSAGRFGCKWVGNLGGKLLAELEPNIKLGSYQGYIPTKYKYFENIESIIKDIDPDNKLHFLDSSTIIELSSTLNKKDMKLIFKYSKGIDKVLTNSYHTILVGGNINCSGIAVIESYYKVRYPSYDGYHIPYYNKMKLVPLKELKSFIAEKHTKNVILSNFQTMKTLKFKINKPKRLLKKLFIPNFKFTWELIDTKEKLEEMFNEVSMYVYTFCIFYKIYYRGSIMIIGLDNIPLSEMNTTDENSNYFYAEKGIRGCHFEPNSKLNNEDLTYIKSFIDPVIYTKLTSKSLVLKSHTELLDIQPLPF